MPNAPELDDAWPRIRTQLRGAVDDSTYHLWLEPLRPRALDGVTLTLAAPPAIHAWLTGRFRGVLERCVAAVLGPEATVAVVSLADAAASPPRESSARPSATAPATEHSFNPKYSFEQFVISESNHLAHAAALAVAELPGQAYNPLFIYGAPGLGKTHLLHAIGNYLESHGGGLTVRYTTGEAFTNGFLRSLAVDATREFKALYRDTDVLLVDDVQFLERKAKTEEEFFHTFSALYETGSQLVLTSDRPPRDLAGLEDRLRQRFEAGLVTDVGAPDLTARMTILRTRADRDRVVLADDEALRVIAERMTTNVRLLEGVLIRLVAFHSLTDRSIDGALAREVLDSLYPETRRARPSLHQIEQATCEAFSITRTELLSSSRARRVTWPRQVAMYLARELTDHTLPAIGQEFGGRNHATVLHACERTATRIAADHEAYHAVDDLSRRLSAHDPDRPG